MKMYTIVYFDEPVYFIFIGAVTLQHMCVIEDIVIVLFTENCLLQLAYNI